MVTTRWIRLATLAAFIVVLMFMDGWVPLISVAACAVFAVLTGWQLWKLYHDDAYRE